MTPAKPEQEPTGKDSTKKAPPARPKVRPKVRVDSLVVEQRLAPTKTAAQALILAGLVFHREQRLTKPGDQVGSDAVLEVRGNRSPWVSRGGTKLAAALDFFKLDVAGKVALDIGAGTGGFTDVLLSRGATMVYAVDVGRAQLAHKLRTDKRVMAFEGVNARYLSQVDFFTRLGRHDGQPLPGAIVCDVSFIGLEKVLPEVLHLATAGAWLVALIKPQFQLRREQVGAGGIVREATLHEEACSFVRNWLEQTTQWHVLGITESPILGAKGNREFLIAARHR